MNLLLWRSALRYLPRHSGQLALAILGIALGVAVVLAVDLAIASARKSLQLSMEHLSGRATHQIVGGEQGVPETLYVSLKIDLGLRRAAPVVTGFAALAGEPGRRLRIIGIDPLAEAPFRNHLQNAGIAESHPSKLLTEAYSALLPADLTPQAQLLIGGKHVTLNPVGSTDLDGGDNLVVTDISTAQALFDKAGRLDHIDLILPQGDAGIRLAKSIADRLPSDLRLESVATRNRAIGDLSAAFELNLSALSLLALVVGMFLIYNTMTFAVLQRRTLLGALRVLGASRRELLALILGEALLLGLAGLAVGGPLGVWLGSLLVQLVTRTIDDLYYVVTVREFFIAPLSLLKTIALALFATTTAAWLPAREAAATPPVTALSQAHLETQHQHTLSRLNLVALPLLGLGAAILALSNSLIAGFIATFIIIFGLTLLVPSSVVLLARLFELPAAFGNRLFIRMALRDSVRNLSRTGVAVAALMVAFAAAVGIAMMVNSFRSGVELWLGELLNADVYITPLEDGDEGAPLQPDLLAALRASERIAAIATYRHRPIWVNPRLARLIIVDPAPRTRDGYRLKSSDAKAAWRAFTENGAVLISEPLAYHHRLEPGDSLDLNTDQGSRSFAVAGVFYDYGSEHGRILMHRRTYEAFWTDRLIHSAAVYAAADDNLTELRRHLEQTIGLIQPVAIRSNRDIRENSLAIFDRTFRITEVLRILAIIVACVGMLGALMALQLERARHHAILRAIGMTHREIGWLVALQSGFLGLAAGLFAVPVGLAIAALLTTVIQRRAFGWTLPFQIDPLILLQTLALAVCAALLASLYPAWRMARTNPAQALRSE